MIVTIHATERNRPSEKLVFVMECTNTSDLAIFEDHVIVKNCMNIQYIIPWDSIDWIEQDMQDHVDELQDSVLETP